MKVRPLKSSLRYLSLNLSTLDGIAPDWLLVLFEIARQAKIQNLSSGDVVELRKPIWDAAGVKSLDRRKKVIALLEKHVASEVIQIERKQGRCPKAVVGDRMGPMFH